jgi:DNA adenine methylase
MRYVGGKSKIAGKIANTILAHSDRRVAYLEPFVGGGAVFAKLGDHFLSSACGDTSADLILMWQALANGWTPPTKISENEYRLLKGADPSPLRGLAGFGGSFGGKWFGGYARGGYSSDGTPRNHFGESTRAATRIAKSMKGANIECKDYSAWNVNDSMVVYCDPPYADTQDYDAIDHFSRRRFWHVVDEWAETGAFVYVSEYKAPSHWKALAEFPHRLSLTKPDQGRGMRMERLFIPECQLSSGRQAA